MNISREGLDFLIKVLPKMKFAQIVMASQLSGVELIGLLNIRTAGSIQRSIFAKPLVDENVIEIDDSELERKDEAKREKPVKEEGTGLDRGSLSAVPDFNNYLKNLTKSRYLTSTKKKLEDSLGEKIQEIVPKLDQFATPGEDYTGSSKEVKKFAKENDLDEKQTKLADAYVSLLRHEKGYLDPVIAKIIASAAKSLTGNDVSLFLPSKEDAMNAIVTVLQLGRKTFNKEVLEGEVELEEGEKEKIEDYLNEVAKSTSADNYVSANLIISVLKSRSKAIASNIKRSITGTGTIGFKKFLEDFKSKNEDVKDIVDFLGASLEKAPNDNSKSSWKGFIDSKKPDSWTKDAFNAAWEAYSGESSRKTKKTESVDKPVKLEEGEGSMLETMKNEKADSPDESLTKSEVKKIYNDIKENLEIDIYNKIQDDNQAAAFEFALEDVSKSKSKGGTPEQYKRNSDAWKKFGINDAEDFRKFVKPHFIKLYKELGNKIKKLYGEEFVKVLTSSRLSHQLLLRAISNDRIKLASKVSKLSEDMREGNVKVYESSNPQFSHEFYWKNENGKVHIAEVVEVKGDHIDEAYQAAFDAVKQEVLMNNSEISLG